MVTEVRGAPKAERMPWHRDMGEAQTLNEELRAIESLVSEAQVEVIGDRSRAVRLLGEVQIRLSRIHRNRP